MGPCGALTGVLLSWHDRPFRFDVSSVRDVKTIAARRSVRHVRMFPSSDESAKPQPAPGCRVGQEFNQASRSALIVAAWVVGMPCGNPLYVFSVPFRTSFADSGPESA